MVHHAVGFDGSFDGRGRLGITRRTWDEEEWILQRTEDFLKE